MAQIAQSKRNVIGSHLSLMNIDSLTLSMFLASLMKIYNLLVIGIMEILKQAL